MLKISRIHYSYSCFTIVVSFSELEHENHISKEAAAESHVRKEYEIADFWIMMIPDSVHKNVNSLVPKDSFVFKLA